MRLRGWILAMAAAAALAAPGIGVARAADDAGAGWAVVVGPNVAATGLTFGELRHLFLGERKYWTPGSPVTLVLPAAGTPERAAVLKRIYEMTEPRYKQYWVARVFRDESTTKPKVVSTAEAACKLVAKTPGALTVVSAARVCEGAKVLKLDGKLAGEEGYALQ